MNESANPSNRGLPCLTGARFVAALLVVLYHFGSLNPLPGIFFQFGTQAVSFFFILSGVVLTYTYRDAINSRTIGWSHFLNLRLARIVPVFVVIWLVRTVLHLWFTWNPSEEKNPVASWIMGLLCVQVYWPSNDILFKWNPPAWSVSCELFFYALFPLLLPPLARRLRSSSSVIATMFGIYLLQVALYLCASGILAKLIGPGHSFLGYQTYGEAWGVLMVFPPLRLGEFVIGMCLGLLILRPAPILRSPLWANLLLAFCVLALVVLIRPPGLNPLEAGMQRYLLFVPVLALTLVALVSGLTLITPLLEHRIAILLGEASYSLYLVHSIVRLGPHPTKVEYVLCIAGSIVAALVLYWVLERPTRRIWRQVLGSHRASSAKPVAYSDAVENNIGSDDPATVDQH